MEIYRKMMENDIPSIYAIEVETFTEPWSLKAFKEELHNDKALYVVSEIEGRVVGYAGLWQIFNEGHITNVAVEQEYQGQGIGRKLVQWLQESAINNGVESFTLEVRVSNLKAIKLYKSLGYKEAGTRKSFYNRPNEDALIMWRR